ncbi:conserved hypothetical protein [Candidatus Sulfopaludibacter sp. SbA3]|nr:conserved hypothetical protein [Candidatus Sulfopaludibacter sp. SbA3]
MNCSSLPKGRARGRLQRARENGYLNAACDRELAGIHSQWCWRLRIPVVWMERCAPRSPYGRVHLDLFTTPHALTATGRGALEALSKRFGAGKATISAHDACWERVPLPQMEHLARTILRAVNRPVNFQLDLPQLAAAPSSGPAKLLPFPERATA